MVLQSENNVAIESFISLVDPRRGLMAIGYFLIKINGVSYGVKEKDATALANSYDAVVSRLEMRGKHIAPADWLILPSLSLAQILHESTWGYMSREQFAQEFNISQDKSKELIYKNNLMWAPDGDAAFDDGSRIYQFDIDDETVRLIGFNATHDCKVDISTLTDVTMNANDFYSVLKEWAESFYAEWKKRTI